MVDGPPPDAPHAPLGTVEELSGPWARFREGATALCPADGGPMALSVDGAMGVYRFVCTSCGLGSAWFDASLDEVHVRGPAQPGGVRGIDP